MLSAMLEYKLGSLSSRMVNFCAVYGCGSRGDRNKRLFVGYLQSLNIKTINERYNCPLPAAINGQEL